MKEREHRDNELKNPVPSCFLTVFITALAVVNCVSVDLCTIFPEIEQGRLYLILLFALFGWTAAVLQLTFQK